MSKAEEVRNKPNHITTILCLCILATVGGTTKLAAQDGCPPATCPQGSHSVCHKECDPNVSPICSPRCVCRCAPDDNYMRARGVQPKEQLSSIACVKSDPRSTNSLTENIRQEQSCDLDIWR